MSEIYRETFKLRTCDCDLCGQWSPSAILEIMQETAGAHSAQLGLDRKTMTGMKLAWVLSRVKVEMEETPFFGTEIVVATWPTTQKHMFFPRTHVFETVDGKRLGCANSLWVLMDVETRRVTKSEFVSGAMPDTRHMEMICGMPATVRPLDATGCEAVVIPQFMDFDINGHVNNTKYMNWCCNALGTEIMQGNRISGFDVNYVAELLPGTEVRTELRLLDDRFSFQGFSGENAHFAIGGRLQPRQN